MFKNSILVLNSSTRTPSIDVWRGIAILIVVLFHFNGSLPFGYIGVDLFFVISGLLVGGILTKKHLDQKEIKPFHFFLKRGFKIWPSYYTFIILGTILASYFFNEKNAGNIIPYQDLPRYLFFYQNYTGEPFHWSFDHIWSLCVEEHFYILLPILFISIKCFKSKWKSLFFSLITIILIGFLFKCYMLYFTSSQDTYSATHNRIDALAWGVLLNLIVKTDSIFNKVKVFQSQLILIGALALTALLIIDVNFNSLFFTKVLKHSLIPICFTLLILGTYTFRFKQLLFLKIMGYYSYNWYLWHPVAVIYVGQVMGYNYKGLIVYLLLSFAMGVIFTLCIEEPFMKLRNKLVK